VSKRVYLFLNSSALNYLQGKLGKYL